MQKILIDLNHTAVIKSGLRRIINDRTSSPAERVDASKALVEIAQQENLFGVPVAPGEVLDATA
jgi:DNA repair photolyase